MFEEMNQDAEGLLAQLERRSAAAQLRIPHVDFINAETPGLIRIGWRRHELTPLTPPVGEFSMASPPPEADIRQSIAQLKSLFFSCLGDNTHLMTELPPEHGEKCSKDANYETSPAGAGVPAVANPNYGVLP
jgi:hypothetical protein